MTKPRVLVVDDQLGTSDVLQSALVARFDPDGRCEWSFCSGQKGGRNSIDTVVAEVGKGWPPDGARAQAPWALVLLDVAFYQSPTEGTDETWGFVLLERLRGEWPELPIVMLTSEGAAKKKATANWKKADGFLVKPRAGDAGSDRAFLTRLYSFGLFPDQRTDSRLAGASLPLLKVLQEARRFACDPLGSGRILYGETGTGKTELARFIHAEMALVSGRSGALRTWSAAGMDETITKDALFGHWKNAHNMATTHEAGEIEKANAGTFFLDEVASLPPSAQALFLESRRRDSKLRRLVSRMGTFPTTAKEITAAKASVQAGAVLLADRRIAVDVVMLTASNVNLHDPEVSEALGFRQDLLNDLGAPICLPTLNERREDIPEIFRQIVRQISTHLGRPDKAVDSNVLAELQRYDWTAKNIVALRQWAEHAVIAARDFDEILIRHLPPPIKLPRWAGDRPKRRLVHGSTEDERPIRPDPPAENRQIALADLPGILEKASIPADPDGIKGSLPVVQEAWARLVLRLFGAALRATRDRRDEATSSLKAVCLMLGDAKLEGKPQSYAAYDTVLRILSLCDRKFRGLPADKIEVLSEDSDVKLRVAQAIDQRRRPGKRGIPEKGGEVSSDA